MRWLLDDSGSVVSRMKYQVFGLPAGDSGQTGWTLMGTGQWARMSVDNWATLPVNPPTMDKSAWDWAAILRAVSLLPHRRREAGEDAEAIGLFFRFFACMSRTIVRNMLGL